MADSDFRFEIDELECPELGQTHRVRMFGIPSGELLDDFMTDDPGGAVEAAREAQAYTLEERLTFLYRDRGW